MYNPEVSAVQASSDMVVAAELPPEGSQRASAGDVLHGLSPEQTRLALLALDVFQQPFDASGAYEGNRFAMRAEDVLRAAVKSEGVEQVAAAFRYFRYMLGETDYRGIQIVASQSTERTKPDTYLDLMQSKKLIINRWNKNHDEQEHLAGGLLATGEVATVLSVAAQLARQSLIGVDAEKYVARDIDLSISYVRRMWLMYPYAEKYAFLLADKIAHMYKLLGSEYSREDARAMAQKQLEALKNWKNMTLP